MDALIAAALGTAGGTVVATLASRLGRAAEARVSLPRTLQVELTEVTASVSRLTEAIQPIREAVTVLLGAAELLLLQEKDRCEDCPSVHRSSVDSIASMLSSVRDAREES